jgi:hypothetical protein
MCNLELERYIFNCIARYEHKLWQYREDAEQEIRLAILLSNNKKEALQMANRNCSKMLRRFGHRHNGVHQRYEAHVRRQYNEMIRGLNF